MAPLSPLLRPGGSRLWKPGQVKPTGLMRINWDHPLAAGLIAYWIDTGTGLYIDLVNFRVAATVANNTSVPVPDASPYGTGFKFNVTRSQMADPGLALQQSWAAPYSVAAAILPLGASTGTQTAYFGLEDASGNDAFAIYGNTTTTIGISYANLGSQFSFTYAANTFYVVVGAATGTNSQAHWVNGIAQTAGTQSSTFSGSGLHYCFNPAGSFYNSTSVGACNAYVFFGAVWLRALSQADAIQLTTDPYCFLVPQEPEMMIIQTGIVDVLSAQVWM